MITKAIIPVAGWGTRWLPITKSIEKCMIPIGNRPVVDYVVQDCIDAGIKDIYFIVSESSKQLQKYYEDNQELNNYLAASGKQDMINDLSPRDDVRFHYITQSDVKYGTAVPIALAAPNIDEGESVVVLMGDDFIYNPGGRNPIEHLMSESEGTSSLLGVNIPREQVGRYGVIEMTDDKHFVKIVEKPRVEDAPSTLINISKYVLNKEIVDMAVRFVDTEKDDEYYITDVINDYVGGGGRVKVVEVAGEYLDGGNPTAWLHANRVVMGDIA